MNPLYVIYTVIIRLLIIKCNKKSARNQKNYSSIVNLLNLDCLTQANLLVPTSNRPGCNAHVALLK